MTLILNDLFWGDNICRWFIQPYTQPHTDCSDRHTPPHSEASTLNAPANVAILGGTDVGITNWLILGWAIILQSYINYPPQKSRNSFPFKQLQTMCTYYSLLAVNLERTAHLVDIEPLAFGEAVRLSISKDVDDYDFLLTRTMIVLELRLKLCSSGISTFGWHELFTAGLQDHSLFRTSKAQ